jgi:hypothetical protein
MCFSKAGERQKCNTQREELFHTCY